MDTSVARKSSPRKYWSTDDIREQIERSKVVVFAKGTRENPRCGFSEKVFEAIENCGMSFETVDTCEDTSIAAALRAYSGEQVLPSVFTNGEFVGSSDTLLRMAASGELSKKLKQD